MQQDCTALERAFQLAKSGAFASTQDIKARLTFEGYSAAQITGRVVTGQLSALIRGAYGIHGADALQERDA